MARRFYDFNVERTHGSRNSGGRALSPAGILVSPLRGLSKRWDFERGYQGRGFVSWDTPVERTVRTPRRVRQPHLF
jgi:hypothetical protein